MSDQSLLREIDAAPALAPTLWWLGQSGFVIKYHSMIFYIDPYLSDSLERARGAGCRRLTPPPVAAEEISHADLVLCTHTHPSHMDQSTLLALLDSSRRAKLVLPKSAVSHAHSIGISYDRMTTTDSDLRVEYFKGGIYVRVYAVPSAHEQLEWTPLGGYPYLGYLVRCGGCTIYHAGDCVPYEGLADRLRRYNVTVALLPISGRQDGRPGNFDVPEAAQLAEDIDAGWLVPMHFGMFSSTPADAGRFVEHMLFHRPLQRFKVFRTGEGWEVPED